MGTILQNMNRHAEKEFLKQQRAENADKPQELAQFEEALEKGATLTVFFDLADDEGNLYSEVNGLRLILPSESFKKDAPYYNNRLRSSFLATALNVRVESIDKEKKIIYLESFKDGKRFTVNQQIERELIKLVQKNKQKPEEEREPIKIYGQVNKISADGNVAFLKLATRNVRGRLSRKDWNNSFTRNLSKVVKEGDIIEVLVTDWKQFKTEEGIVGNYFSVSHKELAPDPWQNLPDNFKEGSVIVLTCTEKKEDENFGWGYTEAYPEVEFRMRGKEADRFALKPGWSYKCKITKVDKDQKRLRANPFEVTASLTDKIKWK